MADWVTSDRNWAGPLIHEKKSFGKAICSTFFTCSTFWSSEQNCYLNNSGKPSTNANYQIKPRWKKLNPLIRRTVFTWREKCFQTELIDIFGPSLLRCEKTSHQLILRFAILKKLSLDTLMGMERRLGSKRVEFFVLILIYFWLSWTKENTVVVRDCVDQVKGGGGGVEAPPSLKIRESFEKGPPPMY